MSGHSYGGICPNCGQSCNFYSDAKPFQHTDIDCIHCGFITSTTARYMNLEEINERRIEVELKPLKKLPKQKILL